MWWLAMAKSEGRKTLVTNEVRRSCRGSRLGVEATLSHVKGRAACCAVMVPSSDRVMPNRTLSMALAISRKAQVMRAMMMWGRGGMRKMQVRMLPLNMRRLRFCRPGKARRA